MLAGDSIVSRQNAVEAASEIRRRLQAQTSASGRRDEALLRMALGFTLGAAGQYSHAITEFRASLRFADQVQTHHRRYTTWGQPVLTRAPQVTAEQRGVGAHEIKQLAARVGPLNHFGLGVCALCQGNPSSAAQELRCCLEVGGHPSIRLQAL
jgi:hypothetical protein